MSGSGWYDPYGDNTNWDAGSASGATDTSPAGLIGGQYAGMQANAAANGSGAMNWPDLAPATDPGSDGTGLPVSVTVAPYLPRLSDPASSWQPVSGDGTGLPPSVTIAPYLPQLPDPAAGANPGAGLTAQKPFDLYDTVHSYLNTPGGSNALQIAQDASQSIERAGSDAAALGAAGFAEGFATANPYMMDGSAVLAALGGIVNLAGKGLDGGTSFFKSIQQDNSQPLKGFGVRAVAPDFTDLEIPKRP